MIDYGTVRSTVRPEPRVIDDYSVWENTNIHEVQVVDGIDTEETHTEYEFKQVQYTKDEYLDKLIVENEENNRLMNTILGVNE